MSEKQKIIEQIIKLLAKEKQITPLEQTKMLELLRKEVFSEEGISR